MRRCPVCMTLITENNKQLTYSGKLRKMCQDCWKNKEVKAGGKPKEIK